MRILQFILFLLVPLVNFGAQAWFGDPFQNDSEVLIQPAGYAFAIWGPIFLGMIIYSWFQLGKERVNSPHLRKATYAGIAAALASICFVPISYTDLSWLVWLNLLWHFVALIILFFALRRQLVLEQAPSTRWYYLPTQMYLGWICAATAVSFALFFRDTLGVQFALEIEAWITAIVIFALTGVGLLFGQARGLVSALTIVWALVGIIVANSAIPVIYYSAFAGIVLILAIVGYQLARGTAISY